jgi:hypothetical protein
MGEGREEGDKSNEVREQLDALLMMLPLIASDP